jgi:hypothetical protein
MIEFQEHDCLMYDRVRDLEIGKATSDEKIMTLCNRLTNLTTATWGVFAALIVGIVLAIFGLYVK